MRDQLSTTEILNATSDLVARVSVPWGAILLLTLLPYRFLQVHFIETLISVGPDASQYGEALLRYALATCAALLLAMYGRLVFLRACRLAASPLRAPGAEAFKVRPLTFLTLVYTGLLFEILLVLLSFTIIAIPIVLIFAALAAVTADRVTKPSLLEPLKQVMQQATNAKSLAGIIFTFLFGFAVALLNLQMIFQLGVWMAGGITGFDLSRWQALLSYHTRLFILLTTAGALMIAEPFWLAAHLVYVAGRESRQSGEDLREWFYELRGLDRPSRSRVETARIA